MQQGFIAYTEIKIEIAVLWICDLLNFETVHAFCSIFYLINVNSNILFIFVLRLLFVVFYCKIVNCELDVAVIFTANKQQLLVSEFLPTKPKASLVINRLPKSQG